MTELEVQLRDLGATVAYPPTPDLAGAVRRRLAERPMPWWRARSRRQALAIALAVLAVAVAAVMAVPEARTAILRFLRIGSVTVERVETLPPAQERPLSVGLGRRVSVAEGERIAGFRMLLPPLKQPVERVYARGNMQSAFLDVPDEGSVLLTEIRGSDQFGFAKKAAGEGTRFEEDVVNGEFALWIVGAPHVVMFREPNGQIREVTTRLAGNVLVWTRGDLTLRLEGELTKERALEIARSTTEPPER
jgi:hypothetical protein